MAYNFSQSTDGPFSAKLNIPANIFFGSIFCTNSIVTSLTAFRIWKCRKLSAAAGATTDYTGAFNIVVESGPSYSCSLKGPSSLTIKRSVGAVYSLILCMEMLLYALGENFVFVLYTSMAQITVSLISTRRLVWTLNIIICVFRVLLQLVSSFWY